VHASRAPETAATVGRALPEYSGNAPGMHSRSRRHRIRAGAAAALVVAACAALPAHPARGTDDPGRLRDQIAGQKARERVLASAAARLGRLEAQTSREIAVLTQRLAAAQADLASWEARLADTQRRLREAQKRLVALRARLAEGRRTLAALLRARYAADVPDLIETVLDAHGFADLLERMEFLHRVQSSDTDIITAVRNARDATRALQRRLAPLERRQARQTETVRRERDALAAVDGQLRARRAALAEARAARLAALAATTASRRRAEHTLDHLLAARAAAARQVGPGGPWAIPWPIVQCESGGQNLPPNAASASGYYQMLDSTWHGLGGTTPHAYQASKAEQDRLAARLWAGGAGARNWVCAALVGAV
jgi:peptidoglycan hydrolase CwlO-like protein